MAFEEDVKNLVLRLHEVGAVKFGKFITKIGIETPVYFDLRVMVSYPDIMEKVSNQIFSLIKKSGILYDHICGVPYTALPISTMVSVKANKPMLMRRKETKNYGTKKRIEGHYKADDNCIIIEDVITSGSSIAETVEDLQYDGLRVSDAFVVLDRQQGGRNNLEERGINVHVIATLTEVVEILLDANVITQNQYCEVIQYLNRTKIDINEVAKIEEVKGKMKGTFEKPDIQALQDIANRLRIESIRATNASKSGHPTSCASLAEIMSVLFFNTMRYSISNPKDKSSDRLILSKGHAAPVLYAAWAEAGLFPAEDLLNLRKIDSDLEGHPTPRLKFIDVGTGSLGQGLSIACGMAYVGKNYDKASYRVYCIVGDGESAEGSVWEALNFASYYNLDNLCVIFDINRLGQSEPTPLQHNLDVYRKRLEAFGFNTVVIDGHCIESLCNALHEASRKKGQPTAILAKTIKGKGFSKIEDLDNWHGKPLLERGEAIIKHLSSIIKNNSLPTIKPKAIVDDAPEVNIQNIKLSTPPKYRLGEKVATRLAYGTALAKIAADNNRVIALDGDTKNSTYSEKLKKAFPDRYIECFIAEQNLAGVAVGACCRDRTVAFASTFATFLTRSFDQIRMAAISQSNVNFAGSHCGVSIGEDGPSQMGLEDIALFRSIPGSTIFYPSDAVSAERSVELAANTKGICFIRTSRPASEVIYKNDENFEIGKAKIVKKSDEDQVLVIGAGVTLHEALKASEELAKSGINIRILDLFTVKPIDAEGIIENAKQCNGNIITVEDHYPEGGLGEAVLSAVASERDISVKKLAVGKVPRSGPPNALLELFEIDSKAIMKAVILSVK